MRTEAETERRVTEPDSSAGRPMPVPGARQTPRPKGRQRETLLQRRAHFVLFFA